MTQLLNLMEIKVKNPPEVQSLEEFKRFINWLKMSVRSYCTGSFSALIYSKTLQKSIWLNELLFDCRSML